MKQNLKDLIKKHNMDIQGVIHVGANTGEEYDTYRECGIKEGNMAWVETWWYEHGWGNALYIRK